MNPDLHLHTRYSHGRNSPGEMYEAAVAKGLKLIGFSEHSPRPLGYDYQHEYREQLVRGFPDYINEVRALGQLPDKKCEVLLGLEMDWLPAEKDFVRAACNAHDYDYLIGSVHFIDHWGFDDGAEKWSNLSQEECDGIYIKYFQTWKDMLASGLFQIAAHPDLIKIFSIDQFRHWLAGAMAHVLVRDCLLVLRDMGMAMEVSSAGLRKMCGEIYPCPEIMAMAAEAGLRISLASDAHNVNDISFAFPQLIQYAKSFGFTCQTVFRHGICEELPF